MGKKKSRRQLRWSVDDKRTNQQLAKINDYMAKIKKLIGKSGDYIAGSETLIGCVESLNNQARDGAVLAAAYDRFNNTTLPALQKNLHLMETKIEVLDMIAK